MITFTKLSLAHKTMKRCSIGVTGEEEEEEEEEVEEEEEGEEEEEEEERGGRRRKEQERGVGEGMYMRSVWVESQGF